MPRASPPRPIHIRRARPSDSAAIGRNNRALAFESEGIRLAKAPALRGARCAIADPTKGFYLIAEVDGRTAGQLFVTREWSDWRCGYYWWIQSLYVVPCLRRRGVFRALLKEARRLAREDGSVRSLRLYVHAGNRRARAAYQASGFVPAPYRILERDI